MIGGVFPDAAVGHLVMMVLALAVAHGASILGRRASSEKRELITRLIGIALALALIAGGIAALGRGVLSSGPMSMSRASGQE